MLTRAVVVLGVPLDDVTLDEAVELIVGMARVGRATGRTHQVCTVNVDFVVNALDDPELRGLLQCSDLALPDGAPLVWTSRLQGTPLRTRVAGADLIRPLAARAAVDGLRLCFFGGDPTVAREAATLLRTDHPGVEIVVVDAPMIPPDATTDGDVLDRIRDADADVLCLALGNPKQERWIGRYGAEVSTPVAVGIGGSLDFLVGRTRRAPRWMQRAGLEWLHRTWREPRRLARRYARDIRVFVPRAVSAVATRRRGRPTRRPVARLGAGWTHLAFTNGPGDEVAAMIALERLGPADALTVDLAGLRPDDAMAAIAATAVRHAARVGASTTILVDDRQRETTLARIAADRRPGLDVDTGDDQGKRPGRDLAGQ